MLFTSLQQCVDRFRRDDVHDEDDEKHSIDGNLIEFN